jgi:hypothetical protein
LTLNHQKYLEMAQGHISLSGSQGLQQEGQSKVISSRGHGVEDYPASKE